MEICIREFEKRDLEASLRIWNQVIEDGIAFPSMEILDPEEGLRFFREQTYTGVAENTDTGEILGLYILHPNNIGRCGHISNTSYAVSKEARGNGIGEKLVLDSLRKARECGFRILQFNAVVKTNACFCSNGVFHACHNSPAAMRCAACSLYLRFNKSITNAAGFSIRVLSFFSGANVYPPSASGRLCSWRDTLIVPA